MKASVAKESREQIRRMEDYYMRIQDVKTVRSSLFIPLFTRLRLESYNLSFVECVIFSLYADRCGLSIKTAASNQSRFIDQNGEPFIYFLDDEVRAITEFGRDKINAAKKELKAKGLIRTVGRKPQRIYVTATPSTEAFMRSESGATNS